MKRMIGLILITSALIAGLVSGCVTNQNVANQTGSAAQTANQATNPNSVPAAPLPANTTGALFHDEFGDASINNYEHTPVAASTLGDFKWVMDAHRLIEKGNSFGVPDPSDAEAFITRQKNFNNYNVTVDLYQGDAVISGVVFNALAGRDFYSLNIVPQKGTGKADIYIYHVSNTPDPKNIQGLLATVKDVSFNPAAWTHVSVTAVNGKITAQLNGKTVITATAPTSTSGVGVWGNASQSLAFANLVATTAQAGQ